LALDDGEMTRPTTPENSFFASGVSAETSARRAARRASPTIAALDYFPVADLPSRSYWLQITPAAPQPDEYQSGT
jgi:hypothetical protein